LLLSFYYRLSDAYLLLADEDKFPERSEQLSGLPYPFNVLQGVGDIFPPADSIDIVIVETRWDPEGGRTTIDRHELKWLSELEEFLDRLKKEQQTNISDDPALGPSFLFLVEDLSPDLIRLVGSHLLIPIEVFKQHCSGGEIIKHAEDLDPLSPRYKLKGPLQRSRRRPALDTSTELSSMSWWRSGSYGLHMQTLAKQIQIAEMEQGAFRLAWKRVSVPTVHDGKPKGKEGRKFAAKRIGRNSKTPHVSFSEIAKKELRLDCGIFRAYQAITDLEFNGDFTCAVEERATVQISEQYQNCGS
jgi:hypothetical protein